MYKDYFSITLDLIAYCQREGVLSTNSDVINELCEICDIEPEQAKEILDY